MSKNTFELPWYYRQVPRDFMSSPDVTMMTAEEIGSYFLLLQCAWLGGQDCTLPDDAERLAKLARVPKVSDIVLTKFLRDKDGRLYNQRLTAEWNQAVKRSKDARRAISSRWENNLRPNDVGNTTVLRSNNDSNTTKTKTKTKTKTNKKLSEQPDTEAGSPASGEASVSAPLPSDSATRVAKRLAEVLRKTTLRPATVEKWAARAEGITAEHGEKTVLDVMEWALVNNADGFWRGRVFGVDTFARCFKTMLTQSKSAVSRKMADPLAQRAASLQTGHDFSAIAKGEL